MSLDSTINSFVDNFYGEFPVYEVSKSKIIHLTKIGTHNFKPQEIAIIDTPLIQRLKFISQLGPSFYVFPTARHSRFEHTLGVSVMISHMFKSLNDSNQLNFLDSGSKERVLNEIRLSALLHDIGHGPFSHVSEVVMEEYDDISAERKKLKCKPHEAIGYHIIRSQAFRDYFDAISHLYNIPLDTEEIAKMIIGGVRSPENDQYKADFLNGEFDADKLDYIIRDSYFSGVELALGVDRLLLSLGVEKIDSSDGLKRKLILTEKGIMPLEQIIIGKIMLHGAIYHHQKVRALDQMIIALLRMIIQNKIVINDQQIENPIDFLRLDDFDILKLKTTYPKINELCKALKDRQTFKRSLVISPKTVDLGTEEKSSAFWDILKYADDFKELRGLNQLLAERIGNGCTEFDVAIDIPKTPELKETHQKVIKNYGEFATIQEIFPQKGWLDAYTSNKWTGHIFASEKYRKDAYTKGKEFLEELLEIKFNENAEKFAKFNSTSKRVQTQLRDFPSI